MDKRDAIAISTPQGMCATIGGPGSAFTPVKNAAVSTSSTFTMVTVANVTTPAGCDFEGIKKGDVIIEVCTLILNQFISIFNFIIRNIKHL